MARSGRNPIGPPPDDLEAEFWAPAPPDDDRRQLSHSAVDARWEPSGEDGESGLLVYRAKVPIAAPPEEVFSYIADLPRHSEWAPRLIYQTTTPLTDGPARVGSPYRTESMVGGRSFTSEAEIAEYDPPRWLVIQDTGGDREMEVGTRIEYTIRPTQEGCVVERRVYVTGIPRDPESRLSYALWRTEDEDSSRLQGHFAEPPAKRGTTKNRQSIAQPRARRGLGSAQPRLRKPEYY